ncbi:hypothetical protein [Sphingomonas sp.]|uniref:hypothetical protein n=1 Tax=Sphingomonas sp. TaxID=28214 RepID=UPI003B3A6AC2
MTTPDIYVDLLVFGFIGVSLLAIRIETQRLRLYAKYKAMADSRAYWHFKALQKDAEASRRGKHARSIQIEQQDARRRATTQKLRMEVGK